MKFSFGKNEHKCKFLKGGSKLLLMTVFKMGSIIISYIRLSNDNTRRLRKLAFIYCNYSLLICEKIFQVLFP